jgi:hypothetical protein
LKKSESKDFCRGPITIYPGAWLQIFINGVTKMKMAIRIQNNWKEKQQQINGSLPAAPRCLPLQRQERMAFSGIIKAGERA